MTSRSGSGGLGGKRLAGGGAAEGGMVEPGKGAWRPRRVRLGARGPEVSEICLGTMCAPRPAPLPARIEVFATDSQT